MKVGDLVKFNSRTVFRGAEKRYAASGIVVGVGDSKDEKHPHRRDYRVLWADGKRTTEWFCYLEPLA